MEANPERFAGYRKKPEKDNSMRYAIGRKTELKIQKLAQ